jgi:hypothetical protein
MALKNPLAGEQTLCQPEVFGMYVLQSFFRPSGVDTPLGRALEWIVVQHVKIASCT